MLSRPRKLLLSCCLLAALAAGCKHEPQGAAAPSSAPTGLKITLGFKPKLGERTTLVMDAKQVITQTPPGEGRQVMNQEIYIEMDYLINAVSADSIATAHVSYLRLKMTTPTGGGDSAGPGTSITDRIYKSICGKAFDVDFAPTGEIKAVRGLSSLYDSFGTAVPELPPAQRDQLITQLKTQFGEEALKKQLSLASAIFPDGPVDNGDIWHKTARMENFGIEITSDYKLLQHDAAIASIGVTGNLKPVPMAAPLRMGNLSLRYALTGTQTGSISMDVPEGWSRKMNVVQNFSGTVEASGPGISGTQTWPLSLESTTTIETR